MKCEIRKKIEFWFYSVGSLEAKLDSIYIGNWVLIRFTQIRKQHLSEKLKKWKKKKMLEMRADSALSWGSPPGHLVGLWMCTTCLMI